MRNRVKKKNEIKKERKKEGSTSMFEIRSRSGR